MRKKKKTIITKLDGSSLILSKDHVIALLIRNINLTITDLLYFLNPSFRRSRRCRIEPDNDKGEEPSNDRVETGDPGPRCADLPATGILVVRKVADGDLMLLFNVGEERALVVHAEGENAVLIRHGERDAIQSAVVGTADGLKIETVEWGQHGELELHSIL